MESPRVTLDAHSLIWYVHRDSEKELSKIALEIIKEAENFGLIFVPTIALMEILHLTERNKIPKSISFSQLISSIEMHEHYQIVPFDAEILKASITLQKLEIHDRLIAATAIIKDSILIAKDRDMAGLPGVRVLW